MSKDTGETIRRYYLVRSSADLVERSLVGVGWSDFDFSSFDGPGKVIEEIKKAYGIGRRRRQVERFFAIREDDVVVVPLPGSIAVGMAKGGLRYAPDSYVRDASNQREVIFLTDEEGKAKKIPRAELSHSLQSRLRVRGMTVNDLSEFSDELDELIKKTEAGLTYTWSNAVQERFSALEDEFKAGLLENIRGGKTNLQAGGIGLEHLVKELLEVGEGYKAKVLSKRSFPGSADADILAKKSDRFSSAELYVQVKHHWGSSGKKGIEQLLEIQEPETTQDMARAFITSGDVSEALRAEAEKENVIVMDGKDLVDWIFSNLSELEDKTKVRLGIYDLPMLAPPF